MFSRLSEREVGQYPLSIATSLAIESLTNIHPDLKHNRMPLQDYSNLWVNMRTLYRNLLGSLNDNNQAAIHPEEIADFLVQEMDTLTGIIHQYRSVVNVVFYFSDYADVATKYRLAVPRMDNTDKQKSYTALLTATFEWLFKNQESYGVDIRKFRMKIKPNTNESGKTLIITHHAYDLVARKEFDELVLLESHTGVIKPYTQWYTKYTNGKELSMIPFREDFLQVFGDSETFRPMDIKLRRELLQVAEKYKWTPRTTKEMIVYGLNSMKNPYARDILRNILV